MTDANTGKNLGKCFKVVSQAYEEIDALIAALQEQLAERFIDQWDVGDWIEKPEQKKRQGSFYTDYICSALLADGHYLGFQISIIGNGMNLGGNEEPLLHVFKYDAGEGVPNIENCGMGYPLDTMEWKPELWGDSLIVWQGDEDSLQWTFSLRLAALTNKASLEEHIIKPINKLLENPDLTDYENDPISPWEGLICYNKDEEGQLLSIKPAESIESGK